MLYYPKESTFVCFKCKNQHIPYGSVEKKNKQFNFTLFLAHCSENLSLKSQKFLLKSNLLIRKISNLDQEDTTILLQDGDFVVNFDSLNMKNSNWKILSERPIKKSLVVLEKSKLNIFNSKLSKLNLNLNIYLLLYNNRNDETEIREIFKLRNQTQVSTFSNSLHSTQRI